MAEVGDADPARSFLRLPGQSATGRLRLVEARAVDPNASLDGAKLQTLAGHDSMPGCLPSCFLRSMRMSMPVPDPFPVELTVNSVILGSDDPEQKYDSVSITNQGAASFLDGTSTTPAYVVAEGAVRCECAVADVAGDRLQLFEIAEQSRSRDSGIEIDWWAELVLSGTPRTMMTWADEVMRPLSLISFCLDRPLLPERIHCLAPGPRMVDLYVSWRECRAPTNTSAMITMDDLGGKFEGVASNWGRLWVEAPELMWSLGEFQLRRGAGLQSDAFLLLARCIELYFRCSDRFESRRRPPTEHNAIVADTLSSLPDQLRDAHGGWIETSLRNANRRSLLDQLMAVLGSFGGEVLRFCGIGAERSEFARTVRDARNYLTHATSERTPRVPEGRDLVVLQHRLWFLLRACILRELGFDEAETVQRLAAVAQPHYLIRG